MKIMERFFVVFVLLILIFLSVLFFIGGGGWSSALCFSWLFLQLSLVSFLVCGLILGKKERSLKDWIFGYPILFHCVLYLATETIFFFIVLFICDKCGGLVVFFIQFVLLMIHALFVVSCFGAKEAVDASRRRVKSQTASIKELRFLANNIALQCDNIEAKRDFEKTAEKLRYSDPVSNDKIEELNHEIKDILIGCASFLEKGDFVSAREKNNEAIVAIEKRDNAVLFGKGCEE